MTFSDLWDDPEKDYRKRYLLPDQFVWDRAAWPRIDFDGYTAIAFALLPSPPARILDVGCGPGMGSLRLVQAGYDVVGVDYNERAIAFARIMVDRGSFYQSDIRMLGDNEDLQDDFDGAVCIEVLEHVPPDFRGQVFVGIHARLRRGATLVVTTPSPLMGYNRWDYRRSSMAELRCMLEESGFEVTEVRFQHRLTFWFRLGVWRLISNRLYDLRAVRHLMRRRFLSVWNETSDEGKAGRYIVQARRV